MNTIKNRQEIEIHEVTFCLLKCDNIEKLRIIIMKAEINWLTFSHFEEVYNGQIIIINHNE